MTTAAHPTTVLEAARAATKAGIVVLPALPDGSKTPGFKGERLKWSEYETRRPTPDELRVWFAEHDQQGLGFICGPISGGLEMFEFEDRQSYDAFVQLAEAAGLMDVVERVRNGYEETTPGGGIHWFYRSGEQRGNTKLAARPCPGAPACNKHVAGKAHVLIETRGKDGWAVVAPSHGSVHETGMPYELVRGGVETIVTLTDEDRFDLWTLARTLDEMPEQVSAPIPDHMPTGPSDGSRPGDLFNQRASWDEVLTPHGWRRVFQRGLLTHWRRPGKQRGASATTGLRNAADPTSDYLWVFSTSTDFETNAGYSKWRAYAVLNHGGDFQAAARDLRAQGYSEPDIGPLVAGTPRVVEPPEAPQEPPQRERPYRFESVFPEGHFIADYVRYVAQKTDAPHEYHEAIACLLLAAATPGVRARLAAWPNGLATNLYVVLVGESTRSRKSTAINEGKALLRAISEQAVFPDRFSTEALLEQLAMRTAQPSVWCPDELGQVLEDAEQKPLLKDALLTLYDSPKTYDYARHSKRAKGGAVEADHDRVQDPHWNVLGATTETIFDALSSRAVQSGLLPRFAYIYPASRPPRMGLRETTPEMENERATLVYYLKQLLTWSTTVKGGAEVVFAPGTIAMLDQYMYEVEETGETILARLPAIAIKLAMLSALGEGIPVTQRVVIEPQDAERAIQLARKWQGFALRFGAEIGGFDVHERKFQQRAAKALAFVRAQGGRVSRNEVIRHMRIPAKDLDELQRTLIDMGEISVEAGENPNGRPPTFWRCA